MQVGAGATGLGRVEDNLALDFKSGNRLGGYLGCRLVRSASHCLAKHVEALF